jgi:hypothetical protein
MVEPLTSSLKCTHPDLAILSTAALVNLCSYAADIRETFFQRKGHEILLEVLANSKDEKRTTCLLKLAIAYIADSELYA